MEIKEFAKECQEIRESKGFTTTKEEMLGKLMLVVSEIAEAAEFVRDDNWSSWYSGNGKPEGFIFELADAMIRIGDISSTLGYELDAVIRIKLDYNRSRPSLHGRRSSS